MLKPLPELKAEIEAWVAEKRREHRESEWSDLPNSRSNGRLSSCVCFSVDAISGERKAKEAAEAKQKRAEAAETEGDDAFAAAASSSAAAGSGSAGSAAGAGETKASGSSGSSGSGSSAADFASSELMGQSGVLNQWSRAFGAASSGRQGGADGDSKEGKQESKQ